MKEEEGRKKGKGGGSAVLWYARNVCQGANGRHYGADGELLTWRKEKGEEGRTLEILKAPTEEEEEEKRRVRERKRKKRMKRTGHGRNFVNVR